MGEHVKVAIIGGGTAGMRAYRAAINHTKSVRLIESGQFGTTCARVGCMPSKLLIAASEAAYAGRHARQFGVSFGAPNIDGPSVMRRVQAERDRFTGFVIETVENWPEEHIIRAQARFRSNNTLELDEDSVLTADAVVIATGSKPFVPPVFELLANLLLTTDEVFELQDLPRSLIVVGAGAIGLELSQAFARLGVEVTVLGKGGGIGPLQEEDIRETARASLAEEMAFHPAVDITRATVENGMANITANGRDGAMTFTAERVLVAAGRRPRIEDLGLENTDIERDMRGVPLRDPLTGQCGSTSIFIAGDSGPELALLHEAAADGQIGGYNAAHFPEVRSFLRTPALGIVFSDPQIMVVGKTRRELDAHGVDYETGDVDWSDQGRARAMGVNRGRMRLFGERGTGLLLGGEMFGPRAEHFAHLLAWSIQSRLTVPELIERPFYHPVFEEGLRTALRMLAFHLGLAGEPPPRCIDCGPGG